MSDPRELLEDAKAHLRAARDSVSKWERVVTALEGAIAENNRDRTGEPISGPLAGASSPDAIGAVFKKKGAVALHIVDIVEEAQRMGFRPDLPAKQVRTYFVSAMIRRPDLFKRTSKATYGLVKH